MKAILEFTLPEDNPEFQRACQAADAFCAINEFSEYLRGQEKYADPPDDIHMIRGKWYNVMSILLEMP